MQEWSSWLGLYTVPEAHSSVGFLNVIFSICCCCCWGVLMIVTGCLTYICVAERRDNLLLIGPCHEKQGVCHLARSAMRQPAP